jgi:hypothetical protein
MKSKYSLPPFKGQQSPNKTSRGNRHELPVEPQAALQGLRLLSIAVDRSESTVERLTILAFLPPTK